MKTLSDYEMREIINKNMSDGELEAIQEIECIISDDYNDYIDLLDELLTNECRIGDDGIKEYLQDAKVNSLNSDELIDAYNDWASDNRYEIFETNDDDNLDCCLNSISEALQSVTEDYNYYDDYFQFDGYGNLISYSEYDAVQEILKDTDFIESLIEDIYDVIIKSMELLKGYY